ncbi:hypothetical protein FP568_15720 [Pandoraea pnomenusa]|uniref:hypothetical protein n=1 Tax=Pandoraea pnomenusa TaxID=93220 RepID=UPI0011986F64|nr:hypothetical protein [Pandoraea pnomenusa]QDX22559.1 hypothetical protein FP568_15720 [Pandoraea pnomenusa]
MTDRELLELAAKAAGLTSLTEWSEKIRDHDSPHYGMPALHEAGIGGQCFSWNPLLDDGDALRLAVKLQLTVANEHLSAGVAYCIRSKSDNGIAEDTFPEVRSGNDESELIPDDYAATRRAIVRAAAEIGKGM